MASKSMKNKFGMLDRKRVVKDALVVKEDPITIELITVVIILLRVNLIMTL